MLLYFIISYNMCYTLYNVYIYCEYHHILYVLYHLNGDYKPIITVKGCRRPWLVHSPPGLTPEKPNGWDLESVPQFMYPIVNTILFPSIVWLMVVNGYISGWWYTYPSEKYDSQMGALFPISGKKKVPNHQPA